MNKEFGHHKESPSLVDKLLKAEPKGVLAGSLEGEE